MKKINKLFTVFAFIFLLTGCEWEDVYNDKKYKSILDQGGYCNYVPASKDTAYFYNNMDFSFDKNGFYVSYDKEKKRKIIDKSGIAKNHTDMYVSYNYFLDKEYTKLFSIYKDSGECPPIIYLGSNGGSPYQEVVLDCEYFDSECLYKYKLASGSNYKATNSNTSNGSSGSTDSDAGEKFDESCMAPRSLSCENYEIIDTLDDANLVYIQLGRQKTTDGAEKKYFVVSYDKNYDGASVVYIDENEDYAVSTVDHADHGKVQFYIWNSEIKEIFPNNEYVGDDLNLYFRDSSYSPTGSNLVLIDITTQNIEGDGLSSGTTTKDDVVKYDATLPSIEPGRVTCASIFKNGDDYNNTWNLLNSSLKFMQYLGITLALVLSIIDFIKVVPTNDKDTLKKSAIKAAMRVGIAIVVFFVPIILNLILGLVGFTDATCGLL